MCCHSAFINCLPPPFHVNSSVVDINPEIYDALMNKRAVVALESTIITHGMPHPQNIETAIEVEKIVREQVIELFLSPS
jgi:pseudouridine-5'-phosphate glycosidase